MSDTNKIFIYKIVLSIFAILLLLSNTTGFDLYAHISMYYFHQTDYPPAYSFFDILYLPRYFLLSYIYEVFTRIGVPLGYIALLIAIVPYYHIVSKLINQLYEPNNKQANMVSAIIMLGASNILILFYAGTSMAILWGLAYLITSRKIFLFGALFHPVGIMFYLLILFFKRFKDLSSFLLIVLLFLLATYIDNNMFHFFTNSNAIVSGQYSINTINEETFLQYINKAEKKIAELYYLLYVIIAYFIVNYLFRSVKVFIGWIVIIFSIFSFSVSVYAFQKNNYTALRYFCSPTAYNCVLEATWFDWGEKSLKCDSYEMYHSRRN